MNNKIKTITIIIALIIILGIVITLTAGFNVEMMTKEHKQIQLELGKAFDVQDLKQITDEVFEGQAVEIQKVEVYGEEALISAEEITEEQKQSIISKVNEKYETELKAEDITVTVVPKANLKDYITPHIIEFICVTSLIALYAIIRYRKLGVLKVLVQTVLGIVIVEMLVFSIIAISRILVGSNIVAIMFTTYAIAVLSLTAMFENKLQKIKLQDGKKKKE